MKHWLACLLIFVSTIVHADSIQDIRTRIAWITTEFEQGKITEKEALFESEIISERIEKFERLSVEKPATTLAQKIPEYASGALLRQAAIPSVTSPLSTGGGSTLWTTLTSVVPYVGGILFLLILGAVAFVFGLGGYFVDRSQRQAPLATAAQMDNVDRGPTLTSVMSSTAPQRQAPQRATAALTQPNALPVRRSRRNTLHHSGEIPI